MRISRVNPKTNWILFKINNINKKRGLKLILFYFIIDTTTVGSDLRLPRNCRRMQCRYASTPNLILTNLRWWPPHQDFILKDPVNHPSIGLIDYQIKLFTGSYYIKSRAGVAGFEPTLLDPESNVLTIILYPNITMKGQQDSNLYLWSQSPT